MFEKIKAWIESHPYLSGGAVLLLGGLYLLFSRASASNATSQSSSSTNQYDLEIAQLNASANAQQQQVQGQVAIATINADAANKQVQAQVDVAKSQTDAQLAAQQDYDATQVNLAKTTTDAQSEQLKTQATLYDDIYSQYIQSGVTENQQNIDAAVTIQQQQADIINSQLPGILALENRGGSEEQVGVNDLALLTGQESQTASFNQSKTSQAVGSDIADAYKNAAILSMLGNLGGKILTGLTA